MPNKIKMAEIKENGTSKSKPHNPQSDMDLIEVMEYDFGSNSMHDENDPMIHFISLRSLIFSVLGCCLAVFLFFGAYSSTFALQSSLHIQGGLGTISLSFLYAISLLSYPWLPSLTIRILGLKKTMATCIALGSSFVVSNFYPTWTTILISCAISGVAMSTLWTCIPAYLTRAALLYCRISDFENFKIRYSDSNDPSLKKRLKEREECVTSRVFGFFYLSLQSSMLLGNILAYMILNPRITDQDEMNETMSSNISVSLYCGANFCDSNSDFISKPEEWRVLSLCTVYVCCFIGAFFAIAIALEPLYYTENDSRFRKSKGKGKKVKEIIKHTSKEIALSLKSTWSFMVNTKLMPLAMITLYQGFENAFVSGEFTKAFVSCICGVDCVNYILICYSVTYIMGSLAWSCLIKWTGRGLVLFSSFALILFNAILLLLWIPEAEEPPIMLFLMSAIFGLADCGMQPQIMALYGLTFRDKKAEVFAAVGCADCLGGLLGFTFGALFCLRTKIYALITALCAAFIGYVISEFSLSKNKYNM